MYIQRGWQSGRIGRVRLSKTGRTLRYGGVELVSLGGRGYKANYMDAASRATYWVSGPRKDGQDTLYPGLVEIDDDVREEHWQTIRARPEYVALASFRSLGVHGNKTTR
jgi:hypothetical protein